MSQKYNSEYVNELEAFFIGRNDIINRYGNAISHYLMLPGLIGFWPMATVQRSTGNVPNYAPTYTGATKQDMVYNGNPTFNYTATGVPYIDLDGTGDYLSVADNTDLDILGNESWAAVPGLTLGGWFYNYGLDVANDRIFAKGSTAGNQRSYGFALGGAQSFYFYISGDGAAITTPGADSFLANEWTFIVGRYIPSNSLSSWSNQTKTTIGTAIASIFNSNVGLGIGAQGDGTLPIACRASTCFLCATALSDSIIQSLFQQTRSLFGV